MSTLEDSKAPLAIAPTLPESAVLRTADPDARVGDRRLFPVDDKPAGLLKVPIWICPTVLV